MDLDLSIENRVPATFSYSKPESRLGSVSSGLKSHGSEPFAVASDIAQQRTPQIKAPSGLSRPSPQQGLLSGQKRIQQLQDRWAEDERRAALPAQAGQAKVSPNESSAKPSIGSSGASPSLPSQELSATTRPVTRNMGFAISKSNAADEIGKLSNVRCVSISLKLGTGPQMSKYLSSQKKRSPDDDSLPGPRPLKRFRLGPGARTTGSSDTDAEPDVTEDDLLDELAAAFDEAPEVSIVDSNGTRLETNDYDARHSHRPAALGNAASPIELEDSPDNDSKVNDAGSDYTSSEDFEDTRQDSMKSLQSRIVTLSIPARHHGLDHGDDSQDETGMNDLTIATDGRQYTLYQGKF
jgi:hypothetical protein